MAAPRLRFPQFVDDYESATIENCFTFHSTNSLSRDKLNYNNGTAQNIHYGDIHMVFPAICDVSNERIPFVNSDIDVSNQTSCENGDLIVADASEDYDDIGKAIEITGISSNVKVVSGLHTLLMKQLCNRFAFGYKGYLFAAPSIRKQIKVLAAGAKVLGISKSNLQKVNLHFPELAEQERIAKTISLLDRKIALQRQKIKLLNDYTKGLFESVIKEKSVGDWSSFNLSELLVERQEYSLKGNEYPHVSLTKEGIVDKSERYDRDFLVKTDDKKYRITKPDDICYNPANLKFGVICRNNYGNAIFSPIYVTFEIKENADPYFLGLYLSRWNFINAVRKYEEGTVYERMAVKPEDLLGFEISIPNLATQIKIAKALKKLSAKVNAESEKLTKLQSMKKALLQQMFV